MVNILTSQHVLLCKMLRRSRVLGGVVALSYPMIGENRQLVTNEPVEVQDCRKITDYFRGIYRISPRLIKENQRMSTCNRLDLQTTRISTGYAQKSPRSLILPYGAYTYSRSFEHLGDITIIRILESLVGSC